jgi:hypothetical protein
MNRRRFLRGVIGGAAVAVPLPFLDCFLNGNGTALAATRSALPPVFGSWIQNLGLNPGRWKPATVGKGYEIGADLKALEPFREQMNVISGLKYFLDGRPQETHTSGLQIATMGALPAGGPGRATFDTAIAETIGKRTRFRSLEVALLGSRMSWSMRDGGTSNPAEPSPAALYMRLFGPDFKDPNAAEFTPDAQELARRSVLSTVTDERKSLLQQVGASDRARIDQYFTSLRQIEQQLDLGLERPAPIPACRLPNKVEETAIGSDTDTVAKNDLLFAQLITHAIACDQTRVFNVNFLGSGLFRKGQSREWHNLTHEEPVDAKLGYQPEVTWFIDFAMNRFADFITRLKEYPEGPGSVLDRTLLLWQTDHGYARTHSLEDVPVLTVGSGGGRFRTGMHIAAAGDPATRINLAVQQGLGVPISSWGTLSNQTSRPLADIMA